MNTYVYIGSDMREAQALAMTQRERDRGHRAVLVTTRSLPRLHGLLVTDWEATPTARASRDWPRIEQALAQSQVRTGASNQ